MGKNKQKKKDGQLVIRIGKQEKKQFLAVCDRLDTSAARELRRFMSAFVLSHTAAPETGTSRPADEQAQEPSLPAAVAVPQAPVATDKPTAAQTPPDQEKPAAPAAKTTVRKPRKK